MLTLILLVAAYIPFIISPVLGSCLGSSAPGIAPLGGGGKSVKLEWAGTRWDPRRLIWRVVKRSSPLRSPESGKICLLESILGLFSESSVT